MSEVEVNMQLPTSSAKFNTDGRTDKRTKKMVANVDHLSVVDVRTSDDRMATVGEILSAGVLRTSQRHDVIRIGEREPLPKHVRAAVWWRDNGHCELCPTGSDYAPDWECDHIIPWSAGGSDDTTNLRALCGPHNQERSNYVDPLERPRRAATWWCVNCYSEEWDEVKGLPICPTHRASYGAGKIHCRVMAVYDRALRAGEELPTWHARPRIVQTHTVAHCAHCGIPALTDQPL